MTAAASCPDPGEVHVWCARTDGIWRSEAQHARALAWLQPAERQRHDRYRRDADREMFLLGRVMARTLVGHALGLPAAEWPWRDGLRGRPEIDLADCQVSFNLAHSGGLVACALANGRAVGVDVEDRERPPVDRALVSRCCAPEEQADVFGHGEPGWQDRFLAYWTLKEAYLKARGLGISVELTDVRFSIAGDDIRLTLGPSLTGADTDWAFALTNVDDRHYVAAATPTAGSPAPRFSFRTLTADLLERWM